MESVNGETLHKKELIMPEKRPLKRSELRICVPEGIAEDNTLRSHIIRLTVNGRYTETVCGEPNADSFYILPYVPWLIHKRAICWNCATLVEKQLTPSSNTGVN